MSSTMKNPVRPSRFDHSRIPVAPGIKTVQRQARNAYGIFVAVISTQEAFDRAKQYATELLGDKEYTLEEVEQDVYKNRRVWRITVGFPKRRVSAPELMRSIAASLPLEYKTILVDLETGEPVAMKLAS